MKDYNQEYFFFKGGGVFFPRLCFTGSKEIDNEDLFSLEDAIPEDEIRNIIPLKFADPVPKKSQMGDIHTCAPTITISEKLKNQMEKLALKGLQYIPARIKNKAGDKLTGYYLVHISNLIQGADLEKSKWRSSANDPDGVLSFEKLVLNNEVLDKIPLEDRLVFALEEMSLYRLYHRSVVDSILSIQPEGARFYRLVTWDESQPFEEEFWDYIES